MDTKPALRVVLVDDNDMTRTLLRAMLRTHARCDIVGEANNATAGLDLIQRHMPHAVFLDVEMPDGDGLSLLVKLRQTLPDVSVLMVTAHSDRETVQAAIQRGASGYVVKPFTAARVLGALEDVLKSRGQLRPATGPAAVSQGTTNLAPPASAIPATDVPDAASPPE